jgi:hypothetical protein
MEELTNYKQLYEQKLNEIIGYKISNSQDGSKVLFNTGVPPNIIKLL